jgi:FMN-dependent NADH-azoreductase
MRLLYIKASPRKDRSHSTKLAKAFLDEFQKKNPECVIDTLDLWNEDLPPFDGPALQAKYDVMHGEEPTGEQQKAWNVVKEIATRFASADKFVFSIPMWNYSIPYKLKHYIDVITQPGILFKGSKGLVGDKPAALLYASGGSYPPNSPNDLLKPYMRLWLNFVGITNIVELASEGGKEQDDAAKKLASTF